MSSSSDQTLKICIKVDLSFLVCAQTYCHYIIRVTVKVFSCIMNPFIIIVYSCQGCTHIQISDIIGHFWWILIIGDIQVCIILRCAVSYQISHELVQPIHCLTFCIGSTCLIGIFIKSKDILWFIIQFLTDRIQIIFDFLKICICLCFVCCTIAIAIITCRSTFPDSFFINMDLVFINAAEYKTSHIAISDC